MHLTARGRALQEAALKISRQVEEELAALIGDAEMRRLRSLLDRLSPRLGAEGEKTGDSASSKT